MQHAANAGSWFIIYDGSTTTIDNNTERGGKKAPLDLTGKYSLFCVRVANGLHVLTTDRKGGHRTGNCLPLQFMESTTVTVTAIADGPAVEGGRAVRSVVFPF